MTKTYKTANMTINKILLAGLFLLKIQAVFSQTVDLTSVDEFFKISSMLKQGKDVSEEQWRQLEHSTGYKVFAEQNDRFLIRTVKSAMQMVFGNSREAEKKRILNLSQAEISENKTSMLRKLLLDNYQEIDRNYASLKSFRENYNFDSLRGKAIERLSSFLGKPIDSTIVLKPVYFFFFTLDGKDEENALYIDFNLIYKMTERQRRDFLAHEYFHNYRFFFENHDFNHKNDLNFMLDMIQNEGIADQIDKSQGYESYFSEVAVSPVSEIMIHLYHQAESDLEKIHDIVISYAKNEISEDKMIDKLLEVYKFNGHAIGFYMSSQIVKAGYDREMLKSFYNPFEFYRLYRLAAIKNGSFQLSEEFMDYLKNRTKNHYPLEAM